MAGRTKNVNLNKEPFEGYVRHWRRQWVPYGDRTKENKGAWALRLIKWVQTGVCACVVCSWGYPAVCPRKQQQQQLAEPCSAADRHVDACVLLLLLLLCVQSRACHPDPPGTRT